MATTAPQFGTVRPQRTPCTGRPARRQATALRELAVARPYGPPSTLTPGHSSEPTLATGPSVENGAASKSSCTCGGECPGCKAKSNALAALRREAERPAQAMAGSLRISEPGDAHERQAEQIADRIVQGPAPQAFGPLAAEGPSLDRLAEARPASPDLGGAPAGVRGALSSPGRALDTPVRDFMEERFGVGFAHVRVHEGGAAHQSATALGARAYTLGDHIVFRDGAYRPDTASGQRTLAHELTHVVQQSTRAASAAFGALAVQPMLQRDLAIEPPRPDAVARELSNAEMAAAIAFDQRFIADTPESAAVIEMIRDVLGISPTPAVVDEDFVRAVVNWQATNALVQDGKLGPATARPLFREIGAEGVGRCEVTGVSYSVAGPINVARGAVPRSAPFNLLANFRSDVANGIFPSCCEARQDIQWDAASAAAMVAAGFGNVPHGGFPPTHPADLFIEDRDK